MVIPDPDDPPAESPRVNCPHLESGLLDWHDPNTWGGSVPSSGSDVTLPSNARVVIRSSSAIPKLNLVTIPATSELIFGEDSAGIDFQVDGMDVKGKLVAGSEECRIETPVTITLHGSRPSNAVTNVPDPTYKGISVTGEISLHGKRYFRTWTRLSKTVEPGDSVLLLQHEVNWEAGQEVVLVTTSMRDSIEWHRNEVAEVSSVVAQPVAGVGAAVYLTAPVQYQHLALSNYQGEVGLLTRTITVQGAPGDSEPTDPDPLTCTGKNNFGDNSSPCGDKELTGYGGHIMVHGDGKGYVEGVELYRMGQTNLLGRYPMHFHILEDCPECYFRYSSVHRSYYRCVSIHGTNYAEITENVAYDVRGYCYYLEDGVEQYNMIAYNLAAFIHMIGPEPPTGGGQQTNIYQQSDVLTLPADVTAAGFYITNVHNYIIGNTASGGWAGFAFPSLPEPVGSHIGVQMRPANVRELVIDGNTAHSTGWWWKHAGAFYFGGALYYENNVLTYNPGRGTHRRNTCFVDQCANGNCDRNCPSYERAWIQMTNSKSFLAASVGLNSWNGRMEILGFEAHDVGLTLEALQNGFYIDNLLGVCRTGAPLVLPSSARASRMKGDGFFWYDTGQEHIITSSLFRNCGYRSDEFNQYDTSPTRGCGDDVETGCRRDSTVFGFLTHSDQHNPEIMQATRDITFDNCGRRFILHDWRAPYRDVPSTNSGRIQNWFDADGSATGLNVPSFMGSGLADTGEWWKVDSEGMLASVDRYVLLGWNANNCLVGLLQLCMIRKVRCISSSRRVVHREGWDTRRSSLTIASTILSEGRFATTVTVQIARIWGASATLARCSHRNQGYQ